MTEPTDLELALQEFLGSEFAQAVTDEMGHEYAASLAFMSGVAQGVMIDPSMDEVERVIERINLDVTFDAD
jgi:hypothetical protein